MRDLRIPQQSAVGKVANYNQVLQAAGPPGPPMVTVRLSRSGRSPGGPSARPRIAAQAAAGGRGTVVVTVPAAARVVRVRRLGRWLTQAVTRQARGPGRGRAPRLGWTRRDTLLQSAWQVYIYLIQAYS